MSFIDISLASVATLMVIVSVILYQGGKSRDNSIFALFIISTGMWAIGICSFRIFEDYTLTVLVCKTNYVIASIIAASFFHFALAYPARPIRQITYFILYAPTVFLF